MSCNACNTSSIWSIITCAQNWNRFTLVAFQIVIVDATCALTSRGHIHTVRNLTGNCGLAFEVSKGETLVTSQTVSIIQIMSFTKRVKGCTFLIVFIVVISFGAFYTFPMIAFHTINVFDCLLGAMTCCLLNLTIAINKDISLPTRAALSIFLIDSFAERVDLFTLSIDGQKTSITLKTIIRIWRIKFFTVWILCNGNLARTSDLLVSTIAACTFSIMWVKCFA